MTVATEPIPTDDGTLVLDIPETGALLRCGRSTVYQLLETGELTGLKIGRRRLVTRDSIVAFVNRQVQA